MLQVQPEKMQTMKQAALDLNLSLKKTRKREFLEQMERVVPLGCAGRAGRAYYAVLPRGAHRQATV